MAGKRLDRLTCRELPGGLRLFEARTFGARLRGLAAIDDLSPGSALLIPRCRSVHTLGMRFALDLVFVDGGGRPVRLIQDLRPRRIAFCRGASGVVEARAGEGRAFLAALADERELSRPRPAAATGR